MNREAHPIELALLAVLVVADAIAVLIATLLALVQTVASWRPTAAAPDATGTPQKHGVRNFGQLSQIPHPAPPTLSPGAASSTSTCGASPATIVKVVSTRRRKGFSEALAAKHSEFPPGFEPPIYNVWKQQALDLGARITVCRAVTQGS